MKKLLLLSISVILGFTVEGCVSSGTTSGANLEPPTQGSAARRAVDANGVGPHRSGIRGWIAPDKEKSLLYVSDGGDGVVDILSVPKYHLVGQITQGINGPEGLAVDKDGKLYVCNYNGHTVTVYKHGQITPSLTLVEPDGPDDVAVAENGYVLVGDTPFSQLGGVDVYPPGATSPTARLTNPAFNWVNGVAVDASNNVYAASAGNFYSGVVIKFAKMAGSGTNLDLKSLTQPPRALVDKHGDVVVSDIVRGLISTYPPGKKTASSTISVNEPDRIAFNNEKDQIYVPQGGDALVSVFAYPSGKRITWFSIGKWLTGAAFYPAPKP